MAWCFLYRSVYTCLSAVQVNFAGKIKKKTHAALSSCVQREHRRARGYTWCTLEISFYISLLHYVIWIDFWIWQWLNVFHVPFFVLVEMRNGDKMHVLPSIFDNYSHKYIYIIQRKYVKCLRILVVIDVGGKKNPANCYQHK